MTALSVCLIVKNEERHLPRCLESVRGLADEIVVVDTGSTDRTVEIAKAHGARVSDFVWQDDFSLAKNFSIEQATGEWVLSIDADEAISPRDHEAIRAAIQRQDVDAFLVPQRHYLAARTVPVGWRSGSGGYEEGTPYAGFVDVDCRRLFRNTPRLRFQNRVHEELVSTDADRPLVQARGTWVIHHYGKVGEAELLRAKGAAYLRIGQKKVQDQPRDPQAHYELGVQYAELGQPDAALSCFKRTLELAPKYRDAQLLLGLCYYRLQRYDEALSTLRRSAQSMPQHAAEIALAEGNVHLKRGDERAAEEALRRALARRPGFPPASINLARLYSRQCRLDAALDCLDRAIAQSPGDTELRTWRARLHVRNLARQQRFDEARQCLADLDESQDAELSSLRGAIALGLGDLDEAVAQLRLSLDVEPTQEAALNLSTALEARGDHPGALEATAVALGLAPDAPAVRDRFARLSGDGCRHRAEHGHDAFTIFFYQPHSMPYDGSTPRTRGLGGTESAIVYLAEALVKRGHRCVVFNGCDPPAQVEGVEYARWEALPRRCVQERPDVVVGVRFWQMLGRVRLAPLQIFWTGDAHDQPFVAGIADLHARAQLDLVMLQSDWQTETYRATHGLPATQIVRTKLGSAGSAAGEPAPAPRESRPRRLAYASTPFRGLDVLLELFPRIRAACPDAELEVFSSMRVYGVSEADDRKQFEQLYAKADQPGVTLVGSLPQPELAARLQAARVLAYPNHYAETFCIAAIEAQAAGCVVVTSALGALPETVGGGGVCIAGDPRTPAYQDAFVSACVALLTDDARWQAMSERAVARTGASYAWPVIAEGWEAVCRAALVQEPPELERVAVHLANGRAGLAERMLARTPRPDQMPPDVWDALQAFTAWRAGNGTAPSTDRLRQLALCAPSLRRAGVIEPALNASANVA